MKNQNLTADELIDGTAIVARIISDDHGFDEADIDDALSNAYVKGSSAEEWETRTRRLLKLEQGADA